jgi:hypothetical protein
MTSAKDPAVTMPPDAITIEVHHPHDALGYRADRSVTNGLGASSTPHRVS